MAVLKCSVCGGELDINGDMSVGKCKYCDSTIMIPKNLERKGNLYNRAVFLRQNNEFDKASSVYEEILKEDNADADAHWGLVLSKYGIEYVDDPKTMKKIPTCHRTQSTSILNDIDYKAALEYATPDAKSVIQNEANKISEIQKRILEISQMESPYDIFICYKESDELGNRTQDSTLAQDVYYELTKRGYNTFFARKSLESRLGNEYEPIIYAALNSAKVMIVIGTKPEHFNSVWVRNEWSRFQEMAKNSNKVIIPAYRDISPYELPSELSALQSLDMSKIGFIQDLNDGIDRILNSNSNGVSTINALSNDNSSGSGLDRLIQNGNTYLKLNNFAAAEEVYDTVTKNYPEDYRGWWGKIVSSTHFFNCIPQINQDSMDQLLIYVKKLAPPEEFKKCESAYMDYLKKVAINMETQYRNSVSNNIQNKKREINELNNKINSESRRLADGLAYMNNQIRNINGRIEQYQNCINKAKSDYIFLAIWLLVDVALIIFVIALFYSGHFWWGLLAGFFTLSCTGGIVAGLLAEPLKINDYSADILSAQDSIIEAEKNYKEQEKRINQYILNLQNRKQEIQNYINLCENYLALDIQKSSSVIYEERCNLIGVKADSDPEVNMLKEKIGI